MLLKCRAVCENVQKDSSIWINLRTFAGEGPRVLASLLQYSPLNNSTPMNKERRKRLDYVIEKLEELQAEVASIGEEERESYDNLPDNLNDTDMANQMCENADELDGLDVDFESLLDTLRDILYR